MSTERNNLGYREHVFLAFDFHHTAVEFTTLHELLDQYGIVFCESLFDGRHQILFAFHLGGGDTAATRCGLDKERQPETTDYFLAINGLATIE